jgi:hypothetical protein
MGRGSKTQVVKVSSCGMTVIEPGSSVSIVSDYDLDDWAIEFQSPAEAKAFFL